MGNTRNTGYLQNIVLYDANDNITLPARLAVTGTVSVNNTTPYDTNQFSLDVNGGLIVKNINKTAQFVLINSNPASGGNNAFVVHTVGGTSAASYADIQGYYGTSIAGSTVIRLNPQGGNVLVGSLAGTGSRMVVADSTGVLSTQAIVTLGDLSGTPTSRTITINGTTQDLSANRTFTIDSMVYPGAGIAVSTGTSWGTSLTDNSANWNTAFGWGNHAIAGYLTGITSGQVTTALGFTPYNATNPSGYITSAALSTYATESYVGTQIANLVASSPATLDTLNELAAALGNDAAFSTTVSTALGNRLRVDINTQGLSATLQGYGRTNLGLGTAATSNTGDFAAASHTHSIANVTGLQTALDGKQASGSYAASVHTHIISDVTGLQTALDGKQASLGYTPYNSTNPAGYITSYTETDPTVSATAKKIVDSAWAGTGGHPGYSFSGGNTRFGFSSTAGYVDVYTDGNFYAGIDLNGSNNLVWHQGNLTNLNQLTNGPGYVTTSGLSTDADSEQTVGSRVHYFNSGVGRINLDPRWNESGYDADLGCLHLWSWTAAGVAYGRAGIAFYSGSAYQYLTTKESTTGLFINNTQVVTNSGTWAISISGNAATVASRSVGNSASNVAYYDTNGNLYITNPESYSGEVRLGAAWGRGGIFAANGLSLSTNGSFIDFVFGNVVPATMNTSGAITFNNHNTGGIRLVSSGTGSEGAAFGMQQVTGEGWTGIFVDFEPYTGWGLYHDNPNNYFCVTAEASTGSLRSFTVPSRVSGNRTAHEKIRFDQGVGSILAGGDITAFSDGRVKTDVNIIDDAVNKIKSIRGVTFKRSDSEGDAKNIKHAGVIAQEVLAVLPEVVHQDHNTGMYSVAYGNMAALFIEAIKEQQTQIESQKSEIDELKDLVQQLINR